MLKRREIAFIVAIVTGIVVGTTDQKSDGWYAHRIDAGIDCCHVDGKSRKRFKKMI